MYAYKYVCCMRINVCISHVENAHLRCTLLNMYFCAVVDNIARIFNCDNMVVSVAKATTSYVQGYSILPSQLCTMPKWSFTLCLRTAPMTSQRHPWHHNDTHDITTTPLFSFQPSTQYWLVVKSKYSTPSSGHSGVAASYSTRNVH